MVARSRFVKVCEEACEIIRKLAPYDTGNLALNAIKIEFPNENTCRIYVDESIAPYMVFTNEPWEHKIIKMGNFRPGETIERMRTWDNPNEGWWDNACKVAMDYIHQQLGGVLDEIGELES